MKSKTACTFSKAKIALELNVQLLVLSGGSEAVSELSKVVWSWDHLL